VFDHQPSRTVLAANVGTIIEAATFGPDGQLVTPPSCTKVNFFKDSSRTRTAEDLNANGVSDDSIWVKWREGYSPGQCGLSYDPGGNLYDGGIVWSGVSLMDIGLRSLAALPATMNHDREIQFRWPAQLYIQAQPAAGYLFHYWEVTPTSGAVSHNPNPVLFVPANSLGQRYLAVFQKGASGSPPGDPGGGSTCIDPSLPGC